VHGDEKALARGHLLRGRRRTEFRGTAGCGLPGGVWCRRCEYAGEVTADVKVRIQIPPAARDGAVTVGLSDAGGKPPLVRLTIA